MDGLDGLDWMDLREGGGIEHLTVLITITLTITPTITITITITITGQETKRVHAD